MGLVVNVTGGVVEEPRRARPGSPNSSGLMSGFRGLLHHLANMKEGGRTDRGVAVAANTKLAPHSARTKAGMITQERARQGTSPGTVEQVAASSDGREP